MAKADDTRGRRPEWAPLPTSEFQTSPFVAVGDDLPREEPFVADESRPGPGDHPPEKRNKAPRSSKGGDEK